MTEKRTRILLVEDNPADARLFREALKDDVGASDIDIEHVERLEDALARLDSGSFDIVLLDLGLPDSDSLETFHRAHERAPDVPIVVLTGLNDMTVATAAVQAGAQDYLIKGLMDDLMLVRSVRYAIERQGLLRALKETTERRHRLEQILQKGRMDNVWRILSQTLGRGAAAILAQAGSEAGTGTFDFVMETWKPSDQNAFLRDLAEYFKLAGMCEVLEAIADPAIPRLFVKVTGNLEAFQLSGGSDTPTCHFLRGLMGGIASRLLGISEPSAVEETCEAAGAKSCVFVVQPLFHGTRSPPKEER